MKKVYLFLAILIVTGLAKAQTYDSIAHHKVGWYDIDMRDDMIQLRDGTILAHVLLFELDDQLNYIGDYGNRFYKISRDGAVILDSIFIEDNDLNFSLLKQNPFDNDNVFVKLVRDLENCRTDLCMRFFDDDLHFKPEKEIWVPISDTLFPALNDAYMMDDNGDIILYYTIPEGKFVVKVGLDGTVKEQSPPIPHSLLPSWSLVTGKRMSTFDNPPTKYAFWGRNYALNQMEIVGLDSTLHLTDVLTPDDAPSGIEFKTDGFDRVLDWDYDAFLVASRFKETQSIDDGVRVTLYDKQSLMAIKTCIFYSQPQSNLGCAFPIGLAKAGDGNIYFAYCTQDPTSSSFGNPVGQVSVVKMDADFNIIWQRFCLEPMGYARVGTDIAVLENGGVAVGGIVIGTPPELFFLVFDDEGWSIPEVNTSVRPYTYYPNPAQSEIHLQYSPDVEPIQIELYDIQGRMVRTQCNFLESFNLEGLSAGTYTMWVTFEGGKVFSDKVVKE